MIYLFLHVKVRELLANTMREIVEHVVQEKEEVQNYLDGREDLTQYECYKTTVNHYKQHCFNWHQQEVQKVIWGFCVMCEILRFKLLNPSAPFADYLYKIN